MNAITTVTFNYVETRKTGQAIYRATGLRGTITITANILDGDVPPTSIDVTAPFADVKEVKPMVILTPEQEAEKLAKLAKRAEKLTEQLAKLHAKLAPVTDDDASV